MIREISHRTGSAAMFKMLNMHISAGLALALLSGCGSIENDRRATTLQTLTNGYQSALRWGYYDAAAEFLQPGTHPDQGATTRFRGLRMTGYDVIQPLRLLDPTTAVQTVLIEYLHEDQQVVQNCVDQQRWRWDGTRNRWFLASGLPKVTAAAPR
jgi:hypothetical protein